ncbi:bifunctional 4-alpha-glucanotransferase/amylo-alpha-1,6-glucosidase [Lodderomyces elongisporus]|uniref:bifunctional 4-alpha-glucanotransferase/amylo-alpha-1,6-glucosidase n=1 Tax=Lodderomyces elongisporus TaxID=36914 RepID=UPI00291CBED2|nr:bifunctional 4-alpha-glucanotransferase/amylo-alpha-1,6-glucosidase [Lodderomyces elongisporus]WLF80540.1 bifunctional 4-alpha-glucanotransferase/amylo-alpha-1,6-glucosidase [Lodderomyces elongisporus]
MTNTRLILFRLSNLGEPVNNENIKNGVLTLPADDYPQGFKSGDALFELRFQLNAASQVSRKGVFHTNVPKSFDIDFDRNKHNAYPIESSFHQDITINIPIYKPGAYNYYFTYEDENGNEKETAKFYFNVPPHLELDGKFVPFNSINVETVVSKWIGPYERWNKFFGIVKAKGYNMVHFTPLQQRGESDSPYSIYDQLKWDPKIFSDQSKATKEIHKVLNDNKLLSITDVVWNHTANNSEWLKSAPESGYTQDTAPHLNAAIELDAKLLEFSEKLEDLGLPTAIESEDDLQKIVTALKSQVHDELKLWQYYVFDRKKEVEKVLDTFKSGSDISKAQIPSSVNTNDLNQIAQYTLENASDNKQAILGRRFENELNPRSFLSILYAILGDSVEENALKAKVGEIVDEINAPFYAQYDDDVKTIDQQVADRIRFLRLADNGPRLGKITEKNPLTEPYFTRFVDANGKKQALANNGWIWGGNPLVDFASNKSKAYLRREVIVWGDCVKLRYGAKYEDSPKLWDRIIEYTKEMARVFNGFRIDNCHSTPLPVAERLLDEARKVNPDLYVIAELFSGSEEMDKIFVERLALNSLVREAMQAWSVAELSTLVHKHGGRPIGSLTWLPLSEFSYPASKEPKLDSSHGGYTEMEIPKVLTSTAPHAIFMDCTHDNETPAQKRTVEDTLPNAALVAFCSSAIGSVYGFDECYPHLLNVVDEKRQYSLDDSDNVNNGIGKVKAKLNNIRQQLAEESEDIARDHEMYIHHEGQYITIQRYNARSGKGWFLIARTKFTDHEGEQILSPSTLGGTKVKHEFSYTLKKVGEYEKNDKVLSGIPVQVEEIEAPTVEDANGDSIIKVNDSFIPGSIAVFSTEIPGVDKKLDDYVRKGAVEASVNLDLYDLNNLLYRCSPEELDASGGKEDVYDIPGYGRLVYAGLEGWQSALKEVIWSNNLGSSICDHFRQGSWAADYVVNRLDKYASSSKGLQRFQTWLRERFDAVKNVPYYLRPHYFALIIGIAYEAARFRVLRLLTPEIQVATNFVQSLALTSVQMVGTMNNTSLLPDKSVPCLAAGLPHFSNDYMRCWGRDVFISFRGLLIVPERFDDAKQHILAFAKTLKHGLIPNLLDAGRNPRYNARDAAWFFLQAIQEYVVNVPSGEEILKEKVSRRFPLDDRYIKYDDPEAFSYESSIEDIIFEILERHAKGIKYREANAGPNLDSQMKPEGFDVEVGVDWETGLVHGGQQLNCGTWMDKMGESERAHNKGIPGTPRDGAAVEIQGLLKSALRWVNELSKKGQFKHKEVTKPNGSKITLKEWEQLVQENFERKFYVPEDANEDGEYDIDSSLVNRRGIYKDLYKSGKPYEDYQLRANFPIAMCVAPELFDKHHGLVAIRNADKIIRGPVGIRTLDPSHYNYRPYYNNSVDSDDFATSKGRNYHQGPEWVWCYGYFLRAFLYFNFAEDDTYSDGHKPSNELFTLLNTRIQHHIEWIKQSPWAGLTELTNKDGELCHDSSPTQAWSSSCLLDLYYDLWNDSRYQG